MNPNPEKVAAEKGGSFDSRYFFRLVKIQL